MPHEHETIKPIFKESPFLTSNLEGNLLSDIAAGLNIKKKNVIADRLLKLGIKEYPFAATNKRFNPFAVEFKGDEETYWYNDGSDSGVRIVTFKGFCTRSAPAADNYISVFELSYY